MTLTDELIAQLVAAAKAACVNAYAPYSEFSVGAALLASDGRVFTGVNIENSSYGLTICAERSAVGSAVTAGARDFVAVAVATTGGAAPCGACRQVLCEFSPEMAVFLVDTSGEQPTRRITLADLLPDRFHLRPDG